MGTKQASGKAWERQGKQQHFLNCSAIKASLSKLLERNDFEIGFFFYFYRFCHQSYEVSKFLPRRAVARIY